MGGLFSDAPWAVFDKDVRYKMVASPAPRASFPKRRKIQDGHLPCPRGLFPKKAVRFKIGELVDLTWYL